MLLFRELSIWTSTEQLRLHCQLFFCFLAVLRWRVTCSKAIPQCWIHDMLYLQCKSLKTSRPDFSTLILVGIFILLRFIQKEKKKDHPAKADSKAKEDTLSISLTFLVCLSWIAGTFDTHHCITLVISYIKHGSFSVGIADGWHCLTFQSPVSSALHNKTCHWNQSYLFLPPPSYFLNKSIWLF